MRTHVLVAAILAGAAATQAPPGPGFWEPRPKLQLARQEVGAAVLGGMLYVAGGLALDRGPMATVERLDPRTWQWAFSAPMPTTLHHFAMAESGGRIYVLGGYVNAFLGTDAVRAYDPLANQWSSRTPLPRPRGAMVGVTIGGKIYVVGGVDPARGVVGDLTVYDPATDQHRTLTPMPTPREHLAAAAVGGKLYVAGGRVGGQLFATLECYDPATDRWTQLAPMPTARGGNGAAVLDGRLIVVGGEGPRGNFPEAEEYDPATNLWRSLTQMSVPLHGIYPVTLGDELVVAGGGLVPGYAAADVVISLKRLPDGQLRYGQSTPACAGPLLQGLDRRPLAGDAAFGILCAGGAPPGAPGVLFVGTLPDVNGTVLLGVRLHLDLRAPYAWLPVVAAPNGAVRAALPLPQGSAGAFGYTQFVFAGSGTCQKLSASDALLVKVQ